MHVQTYTATLHTPLFYSSKEGNIIETAPYLSATALSHALGYRYADLRKDYVLRGDDATTPTYDRLADLPFVVSEMTPLSADTTERTFRTTSYTGEFNITTTEQEIVKQLDVDGSKGIPNIRGKSDAGWHEQRDHLGLAPGSTFEFTVWTQDPLPDTLGFRMGISQTGEFRARRTTDPSVAPSLNKYLLDEVYDLSSSDLTDVLTHSERLTRGTDPRLHRFESVDRDYITNTLAPDILTD